MGGVIVGVTICCQKTGSSIDMGYIGFGLLRDKVAELAGEPFASHIAKLKQPPYHLSRFMMSEEERRKLFDEYDAETQRMIEEKKVSIKLVDFCMQPDAGGEIHYDACKELLDVIGDYDDDIAYGYAARRDCAKFADFKELLRECVEHKCMLEWW